MARRIIFRNVICSKRAEANLFACDTLIALPIFPYKERS